MKTIYRNRIFARSRNRDPGYFCRNAEEMYSAMNFPVWIVSDCRRVSDFHYFESNYTGRTKRIRVMASEDTRWVFQVVEWKIRKLGLFFILERIEDSFFKLVLMMQRLSVDSTAKRLISSSRTNRIRKMFSILSSTTSSKSRVSCKTKS